MRRKLTAAAAALLVALLVVAVPAPAHAVEPPPGPVDEILDVTSRAVKSATGSPIGDTVLMYLKHGRWIAGGGSVAVPAPTAPSAVPKPLTAPAALTRGLGGSVLAAGFYGGFALGEAGLMVYAMANETTADNLMCGTPDWYQVGIDVISMGLAPACRGKVGSVNIDVGTAETLRYGSFQTYYLGQYSIWSCWKWSSLPAGTSLQLWSPSAGGGAGAFATTSLSSNNLNCGTQPTFIASRNDSRMPARLIQTSGGAVLATSAVPDPTRTPDCRIDWEDGTFTTGTGTPYKEAEGVPMSASGLGCEQAYVSKPGRGPDLLPSRISVGSTDDYLGTRTIIADQDVPDFGPDERKAFETGNGHGLVLEKVTGLTTSSCMTWAADCSGWWEATDEGTTPVVGGSTYRCTYGGSQIDLAQCGPYRHTFDTKTSTPTITDPVTGTETPWTAQPSTGNSINPGTGPGTGASPGSQCFDTGWAEVANPIDWVLLPVKCALVWAFVPRASVVTTSQSTIQTTWQASRVGQLATAVGTIGPAFESLGAGGCDGIAIAFPVPDSAGNLSTRSEQFLPACPGDVFADVAPLVFWLLTGGFIFGGAFMIKRQLDAFVGNT